MSPNYKDRALALQKGAQTILIGLGPKLVRSGWHIIYNYAPRTRMTTQIVFLCPISCFKYGPNHIVIEPIYIG